jgi:hypothetical protein
VGIGVGDAPVPSAVVMPTTIPPEESCTSGGCPLDGNTTTGVGETMPLLGSTPVEPTWGLGVASGPLRRVESRPPRGPWEVVGRGSDEGMAPPVEPGTINGPRKLDAGGEDGSGDAIRVELAGTMIGGRSPVDPISWPERPSDAGVSGDGVGWRTGARGALPVGTATGDWMSDSGAFGDGVG